MEDVEDIPDDDLFPGGVKKEPLRDIHHYDPDEPQAGEISDELRILADRDNYGGRASFIGTGVEDLPVIPPEPQNDFRNTSPDTHDMSRREVRMFAGIPIAPVGEAKPLINQLIYGRPGSGKTRLAATAALCKAMSPVMFVNAEAGANTIKQVSKDIMILPDPSVRGSVTWEEFEIVYDELDRQCYNTKDGCDYKTVVVDTGTELQKINMDWVMKGTISSHPDRDPDVPALHDWGKSTNRMRLYLRRFRDLPINFILICHEQDDRDNRGTLWKKPDLPGKLTNQVAGLFDQVMYLYTKQQQTGDESKATEIIRILMTGALEGYVTKDRSGNLPLLVQDPNMSDLYNMITKE